MRVNFSNQTVELDETTILTFREVADLYGADTAGIVTLVRRMPVWDCGPTEEQVSVKLTPEMLAAELDSGFASFPRDREMYLTKILQMGTLRKT